MEFFDVGLHHAGAVLVGDEDALGAGGDDDVLEPHA
jgi:hypothetical protein